MVRRKSFYGLPVYDSGVEEGDHPVVVLRSAHAERYYRQVIRSDDPERHSHVRDLVSLGIYTPEALLMAWQEVS